MTYLVLSHCPVLNQQLKFNYYKNKGLEMITDMIKILIIQTINAVND